MIERSLYPNTRLTKRRRRSRTLLLFTTLVVVILFFVLFGPSRVLRTSAGPSRQPEIELPDVDLTGPFQIRQDRAEAIRLVRDKDKEKSNTYRAAYRAGIGTLHSL